MLAQIRAGPFKLRRLGATYADDVTRRVVVASASALMALTVALVPSPSAEASDQPSVLIVGDSVGLAAESKLNSRLGSKYDLIVDVEQSRSTASAPELKEAATSNSAVDVLVIELGYNDGGNAAVFASRVDDVLAVSNADVIVWLTMREDDRNKFDYRPANVALAARTGTDDRLRILDWSEASRDDTVTWDGIHLTSKGSRQHRWSYAECAGDRSRC